MIYNQINALLTDDTMAWISSVLSDSPMDLDLTQYRVEIITTLDAVKAEPDNVYQAHCLNARVWYDAYLQRSSLILSLESSDLQKRALEFAELGVVREFTDYYNPHLVLRPGMPPPSRRYRTFVHNVANIFCSNDRPLEITHEYVTQVDLAAPLNFEYNKAMYEERATRRNW